MALALLLVFAADRSAHATLFACFQALAPLEQATKAAEIAAKAGSCSAQSTGDPVMAMTIAALTAAAMGGAFSTTDQCNALINGAVGKLVATALLTLPLPADAKSLLNDYVNGTTPLTFEEIVAAFPALNAVIAYIHCGCAVAGAPGEYAKIAKEYAQNINSCANFASDAIGTVLNGAGKLGEEIHEALHGPSLKPGVQQEQTCWVKTLPDEIWTATPIYTKSTFQCNVLRCQSGHVVIKKASGSKTLNKCASKCPEPIKTFQSGGLCYSTVDSKPVDGVCTQVSGVVHCCGDGQQVVEWGVCSPACSDGIRYWDVKEGKCMNCPAGWGPTYQASNSSVGTCVECPSGQYYEFASKKCEPLKCNPPSYFDPQRPHSCATCAPGQVYSAQSGKCECGEGTFFKGAGCVCPKNANKQTFAATFTCSCPPGSILDPVESACVCPAGQQMLVTAIPGSVYSSCVPKGPPTLAPPTSQPVTICPPGTNLVNGLCRFDVPAQPGATPLRKLPPAPAPPVVLRPVPLAPVAPLAIRCPPGMVPNATQSACVPVPPPPPLQLTQPPPQLPPLQLPPFPLVLPPLQPAPPPPLLLMRPPLELPPPSPPMLMRPPPSPSRMMVPQ